MRLGTRWKAACRCGRAEVPVDGCCCRQVLLDDHRAPTDDCVRCFRDGNAGELDAITQRGNHSCSRCAIKPHCPVVHVVFQRAFGCGRRGVQAIWCTNMRRGAHGCKCIFLANWSTWAASKIVDVTSVPFHIHGCGCLCCGSRSADLPDRRRHHTWRQAGQHRDVRWRQCAQ